MKGCLARAACLSLVLACAAACGRVGYELLPEDDQLSSTDAAPPDPGDSDAGPSFDPDAGDMDAGEPSSDPDAAQAPSDAGDGAMDAGANQDGAPNTPTDAAAADAAVLDASPPDAAGADASGADASGADAAATEDAGNGDAGNDAATAAEGLFLRYDFEGTGLVVSDRVGTAHGQILGGAQLDGSGALTFDGSDDYVDMPNGLISNLQSVTVVAWVVPLRSACWQRVFDFGSSSAGEGNVGNATSSLALTTASCGENAVTGLMEYQGALRAAPGIPLPLNQRAQVALVMDGSASRLTVYANGAQVAQVSTSIRLSQLSDVNNWLGRSQWVQDPPLRARLEELRIYARALDANELADLHARGPDAP